VVLRVPRQLRGFLKREQASGVTRLNLIYEPDNFVAELRTMDVHI
jgi:hypothetical protein